MCVCRERDIVNFADLLFIVHVILLFQVHPKQERKREASRFSEAFEFKSGPGISISGIIGGAKVKRTHLSTWRMLFKYFNCVLHNYIKHIHNCNLHWLSYFKLHDTL